MKLLVVGGAGYVGRIVCPALAVEHECTHYDLRPVEGAEDHTIIADVNDDEQVKAAVAGTEGILYMPMGSRSGDHGTVGQIDPAFDVNVKGLYRFLAAGLSAGASWFCYVSSMSVYGDLLHKPKTTPLSERDPADSRYTYGISKRVGEHLCQIHAEIFPQAVVLSLRLTQPMNEDDWARWQVKVKTDGLPARYLPVGPQANRDLFIAALRFRQPGYSVINITGNRDGKQFDLGKAKRLFSWEPQDVTQIADAQIVPLQHARQAQAGDIGEAAHNAGRRQAGGRH